MDRTEKQELIDMLYYLKTGAEQLAERQKEMGNIRTEAYVWGYADALKRVMELIENPTARGNVRRQMKREAEQGE